MLPLGLLAVVCMAGCGEKAVSERQQPNIRLITKEVSLGKLQPGIVGESVVASPDSKRVAYVAQRDGEWLAVVDGIAGEEYDYIGLGGFFSPDSKRVAYAAQRGEKWLVVVDGVEGEGYDGFVRGAKLEFDTPKSLHTLALRDNEFLRVEIEIVEE